MKNYYIEAIIVSLEKASEYASKAELNTNFHSEIKNLISMAKANRENVEEK